MVLFGESGSVPKYVITNLKINNFKRTEINKKNLISRRGGGLGLAPQKQKNFFKKSNKMQAFPYYFFAFGKAPYIPKIISLLPSSPKIVTSAPQLPENK